MDPAKKWVSTRQVRTLEGDMKTYEQAQPGTPVQDVPPTQAAPAQKTPSYAPAGRPSLLSTEESREVRATFQNPFSGPNGEAQDEADKKALEDRREKKIIVSPLHTFTSDVADVVKNEGVSLTKVVSSQIARKDYSREEESSHIGRTLIIILLSLMLLGGGGGLFYYFFFVYKTITVVPVQTAVQSYFEPDTSTTVAVSGPSDTLFTKSLGQQIAMPIDGGQIERVLISDSSSNTDIDSDEFFTLLRGNTPDILIRSLDPEFFFGIDGENGIAAPFIIFHTTSFSSADAGMLGWEDSMVKDLQPLFLAPTDQLQGPLFQNTPSGDSYTFESAVISNKDVRAAEDKNGKIVLLYSFIDNRTLVVTTNQFTLKAVVDRLTEAQIVR